jgi:hypothetical protein
MSGEAGKRGSREATAACLSLLLLMGASQVTAQTQSRVLDDFERRSGWVSAPSDGVSLNVSVDSGRTGKAMRLDFDFQGHGGYAVARKNLRIDLPENYAFTFWIRGEAPVNNLEFKLVDSTGDNVWWRNQRNFTFSREWTRVTIRKRQVEFAWGPKGGGDARDIRSIELAITAGTGGKGSVWIDDFRLEPRPPDRPYDLVPIAAASSSAPGYLPRSVVDADSTNGWRSARSGEQWFLLDFQRSREFGGISIEWEPELFNRADKRLHARRYAVELSDDGRNWIRVYIAEGANGFTDYIYLPESESRYLRLRLLESAGRGYGIRNIKVHPLEWSQSPNAFFTAISREEAWRGSFPRYFENVQSYWTMVGGNGDGRRSLLSQDGAFEPLAGGFSVEPFVSVDERTITWVDAPGRPALEEGYLPVPSVERDVYGIKLRVTAFSSGSGDSASTYTWYQLANTGSSAKRGTLYLAVRPFQVNPPWQFLGVAGGVATIDSIRWDGSSVVVNGRPRIMPSIPPTRFGATTFDQDEIGTHLLAGHLPEASGVIDQSGHASGALAYSFDLAPNTVTDVFLRFPLSDSAPPDSAWPRNPAGPLATTIAGWKSLVNRVTIDLPPSAQPIEDALKSTLAYMLINRDGPAIEPGARSYRRSWIRDGAMIGAAFLRMGHPEPVREFIEWYAPYQYESGKVPCCVDSRGADPVPEHDSHGELIHIIAEYYRYTGDRAFLERMWPHIASAVKYIDSLRSTERTPEQSQGSNQKFYGLMPPSISHEGYSAKPVHSYWDDFWVLRGLTDAVDMAAVLGRNGEHASLGRLRDEFRHDLHQSIRRTISDAGIDFIPGSADLADYDPTSTSIALEPGGQLDSLPSAVLRHTFDRYLREVRARRDSIGWEAYTPYEWRNVGAMVRLGKPSEAIELFTILFDGRRPAAWNQWPEVIHRDSLAPKFLGDLPHTWVGSDFVRSLLDMITYMRASDSALVIGAGVPLGWVNEAPGITVKNLPVGQGRIDIRMTADSVQLEGDLQVPPGGILVYHPGTSGFVRVEKLPARIPISVN